MKKCLIVALLSLFIFPSIVVAQSPYYTPQSQWRQNYEQNYQQRQMQRQRNNYLRDLANQQRRMLEQQRQQRIWNDLRRQDEADRRNSLLNCYKYNKGCALELRGLGR